MPEADRRIARRARGHLRDRDHLPAPHLEEHLSRLVHLDVLTRADTRVLAIVGAGVQGRAHLTMLPRVRPFSEIRIASFHAAHAEQLAASDARARAVGSAEEAASAYQELLGDPSSLRAMGERARARVLEEHTYKHRARRLLAILGLDSGAAARPDSAVATNPAS